MLLSALLKPLGCRTATGTQKFQGFRKEGSNVCLQDMILKKGDVDMQTKSKMLVGDELSQVFTSLILGAENFSFWSSSNANTLAESVLKCSVVSYSVVKSSLFLCRICRISIVGMAHPALPTNTNFFY